MSPSAPAPAARGELGADAGRSYTALVIWREPARGNYPDPSLFALSGIEQLRTFVRMGRPPPIGRLTGMTVEAVEKGSATFAMPATGWLLSPQGVVTGGVLAILADAPLGSAVQTALPPMTPYTTSELSMTFLRPATAASGLLRATGNLIHAGRSLALSEVRVEDERGRLLSHGTSRCFVFPPLGPPPEEPRTFVPDPNPVDAPERDPHSSETAETPDPWQREPEGAVLGGEVWDRMSGLEALLAHISGELPPPPIHYLTGCRPVAAEEGAATFAMPATEWLGSPLRKVEGGAVAMLADTAMASTVQTTVPAGSAFASLDLKVNFFRPVDLDGREMVARGRMVHRGRTLAVATAEVDDADGRRVAVAVGTSMLLPDRLPSLARREARE
jgi:uncharacterized protein (TIGR00369 family)